MNSTHIPGGTSATQRRDGLYLMLLGSIFFLLFGVVLINRDSVPLNDFRTAYFSGLCLLEPGCHPFREGDIELIYEKRQVDHPLVPPRDRTVITRNIYLPSAFAFTVPLALVPFRLALALWGILIAVGSLFAAFLIWRVSAGYAPLLSAALIGFCLANSGSIFHFGNVAGLVVPFCIFAVWCFMEDRYIPAAILCLTFGMALKPHDTGLVWLFFLLAGELYRRRALQVLALFAALIVPTVAWVTYISPDWLRQLAANLQVGSEPGGMNYPGAVHAVCMLTNLQTITSFFWQSAHTYNLVAILICAPFVLVWAVLVGRSTPSREIVWFGLAAAAAFSMLPTYHRQYDAKLILLAVPAFAILWSRRGIAGWVSLFLTAAALFLNGDLPWVFVLTVIEKLPFATDPAHRRLMTALLDFPVPLSLLALGAFNLWAFARFSRPDVRVHQESQAGDTSAALSSLR
ncbi:MAG: glycosyltransferase family 87 protein [Terracidiphilus sp.]